MDRLQKDPSKHSLISLFHKFADTEMIS